MIADTLQKYNIEADENKTEIEAFQIAKEEGEKWIKENELEFSKLDPLKIKCEFIHWETLKKDKNFAGYKQEINSLREKSSDFRKALSRSVTEYMERPSRSEMSDIQKVEANSYKFLLEECAAFLILEKMANAIFYPGPITAVLNSIIDYINKNGSADGSSFHWLNMRRTKDKTNKKLAATAIKEEAQSKTVETAINECKTTFFRRISLDESQLADHNARETGFNRPLFLDDFL